MRALQPWFLLVACLLSTVGCATWSFDEGAVRWTDHVPDLLIRPLPEPPGRPRPRTLAERINEFDAVILVTKIDSRVITVRDGLFCWVLRARADEVLKGDLAKQGQIIEIAYGKWHDETLMRDLIKYERPWKRGIMGLETLPDEAPLDYVHLWLHVPGGEDWEPTLEEFRKYARAKKGGGGKKGEAYIYSTKEHGVRDALSNQQQAPQGRRRARRCSRTLH